MGKVINLAGVALQAKPRQVLLPDLKTGHLQAHRW